MAHEQTIRVVVFREADLWVAQCLEYDIGAQAEDIESLRDRLLLALRAEAKDRGKNGGGPFHGIDPAPEYFSRLWDKCVNELTPPQASPAMRGDSPAIRMKLCA